MNVNLIMKSVLTHRFTKLILIIFICLMLAYYFILFFTPGIDYGGVFLKRETTTFERSYRDRDDYNNDEFGDNDILITVQGKEDQDSRLLFLIIGIWLMIKAL